MADRATLLERRNDNGKYRFIKVKFSRNHDPICGEKDSTYYLRPGSGKRTPVNIGKHFELAVIAWRSWRPQVVCENPAPIIAVGERKTIALAVQEYAIKIKNKSKKTQEAYIQAAQEFFRICTKTYLDEITRLDLITYRNTVDVAESTKHNKLSRVVIWLNTEGIKGLLKKEDWPEYVLPIPDAYDADELSKMLRVNPEYPMDHLVLQFFLYSGFRSGEVAHAEYTDIDYSNCTITTQPKPEWDWEPKKTSVKDRKLAIRTVRIPRILVDQLVELRKTAASPNGLIFPNEVGKPNNHFLRVAQRAAIAAGVNARIGLHKFRRTFATMYAKEQGINDAAVMLGHKHLDQIQRYLAAAKPKSDEQRDITERIFDGIRPNNNLVTAAGK